MKRQERLILSKEILGRLGVSYETEEQALFKLHRLGLYALAATLAVHGVSSEDRARALENYMTTTIAGRPLTIVQIAKTVTHALIPFEMRGRPEFKGGIEPVGVAALGLLVRENGQTSESAQKIRKAHEVLAGLPPVKFIYDRHEKIFKPEILEVNTEDAILHTEGLNGLELPSWMRLNHVESSPIHPHPAGEQD